MKSGIYSITHIDSGRQYIGGSVDIIERWYLHRSDLRLNRHHSPHLQHAWNKYGSEAFRFDVLLHCVIPDLNEWEQLCLDNLPCVFNVCTFANRCTGRPCSAETRQKISRSKLLTSKPLSTEHRLLISNQLKGRVISSETRQRLSQSAIQRYSSEVERSKQSERSKRMLASEDARKRISDSNKRRFGTQESREKQSARAKLQWTPEARLQQAVIAKQYHTANPRSAETKQKISDSRRNPSTVPRRKVSRNGRRMWVREASS